VCVEAFFGRKKTLFFFILGEEKGVGGAVARGESMNIHKMARSQERRGFFSASSFHIPRLYSLSDLPLAGRRGKNSLFIDVYSDIIRIKPLNHPVAKKNVPPFEAVFGSFFSVSG